MQAIHAIVHTREQVETILAEAHEIALDLEAKGAHYTTSFQKAADLLGARATAFVQPAPVGIDLSKIKTGAAA